MNVADSLGVSYQAVSNWERGKTMPDIGKLGELSNLMEISIEDMLGHTPDSNTVRKLLGASDYTDANVTLSEVTDVVPILPPAMTEELVSYAEKTQAISIHQLTGLALFLSEQTVNRLALKATAGSIKELTMIAPFVSREVLENMTDGLHAESIKDLSGIAPFVSREVLENMADGLHAESIQELTMIAPFVSREVLENMADGLRAESIEDLTGIASFIGREVLEKMCMDL